ncbi:Hemagglutinin/hemolysin-related protein [Minicystis rosea]|nr:Hemagglutinin/hemolysin-related protein [Minicystis rosea]
MRFLRLAFLSPIVALAFSCAATETNTFTGGNGGTGTGTGTSTGGIGGSSDQCNVCFGSSYTPCVNGQPGQAMQCPAACAPGLGCVACVPGGTVCVGNEVHQCSADGQNSDQLLEVCDVSQGKTCQNGKCATACELAADQPSNVGCEFWAVDLDQQDAVNDPASAPWGLVFSNAGQGQANVTVEINEAPVGQPQMAAIIAQVTIPAGSQQQIMLPTRELDCGVKPNDFASPGTCLSSRAFRITSSAPIVVYQFNVFANAYSNDASLLLPTNALGKLYRIIGWSAGHPIPLLFPADRSYITIVGTKPDTLVKVKPTWRIKGNPPIAATPAGGEITATIGPFDVLNLETDDATFQDDPKTMADLSGSVVQASAPVAVFSGVEIAGAPGGLVDVPTPPGWMSGDNCCLDHLEDQMFPMESVGTHYVIARSPVRSTGSFREADILRFVGVAESATVTTSLPPPYDTFTIQPGEVKTTWTQNNVVVTSDKPVMVGQILVSNEYIDGPALGDPSLTVMPPVEQFRTEYVLLSPGGWNQSWMVLCAPVGAVTTIDGNPTTGCVVEAAGTVEGVTYETKRCQVQPGAHKLSGDKPFGIVAYGYGTAGSYALAGGADVKHVYDPPPIK